MQTAITRIVLFQLLNLVASTMFDTVKNFYLLGMQNFLFRPHRYFWLKNDGPETHLDFDVICSTPYPHQTVVKDTVAVLDNSFLHFIVKFYVLRYYSWKKISEI